MRNLLFICATLCLIAFLWLLLGKTTAERSELGNVLAGSELEREPLEPDPRTHEPTQVERDLLEPTKPSLAHEPAPVYPIDRPRGGKLEGRVVDHHWGPVKDCVIQLASTLGQRHSELPIADDRDVTRRTRTDERGRFTFAGLPVGPYVLEARAPDGKGRTQRLTLGTSTSFTRVILEGPRERAFQVIVKNPEGLLVRGAKVDIHGVFEGRQTSPRTDSSLTQRTDASGRASFVSPRFEYGFVHVRNTRTKRVALIGTHRYPLPFRSLDEQDFLIVLREPGQLSGQVLSAAERGGKANATGGQVVATPLTYFNEARPLPHWERRAAIRTGRYRFDDLPPGEYTLHVEGVPGRTLRIGAEAEGRLSPLPIVKVLAKTHVTRNLELEKAGSIRGTITTLEGHPLEGVRVFATQDPHGDPDGPWVLSPNHRTGPGHVALHATARTDARGQYTLEDLPNGLYRVEIASGTYCHDRQWARVHSGGTRFLQHTLAPGGVLQGALEANQEVDLRRADRETPHVRIKADLNGGFTLVGLLPGAYHIERENARPRKVAQVTIRAGETTWVDLTSLQEHRIVGRVLSGGSALSGIEVRHHSALSLTDAEGRFEIPCSVYTSAGVPFDLALSLPFVHYRFRLIRKNEENVIDVGELEVGNLELTLETVNAAGIPATATVNLSRQDRAVHARVTTSESGRITIPHLLPGTYDINTYFKGGTSFHDKLSLGTHRTHVLQAPPMAQLHVKILRPKGSTGRAFDLELNSTRHSDQGTPITQLYGHPDELGEYTFRNLPLEEVTVVVMEAGKKLEDTARTVRLQAGEPVTVTLTVPE